MGRPSTTSQAVEAALEAPSNGQGPREMDDPGSRVLVADDEPLIREVVRDLLVPAGFRVREARSGREALAETHAWLPDIVLLDICMDGVDGRDVCRSIKGDRELGETVVVLFSGLREEEVDWRGAGADAFRSKRESMVELPAFLRRVRSGA